MFSRRALPVWVGIMLLSGMFLMGQETWPACTCNDYDGDGYGNPACSECTGQGWDCNDNNPDINPGVTESPYDKPICSDGADNDCDGFADADDDGCNDMAQIPAGCFDMGDHFAEGYSYELPVHNVCISAFEMDFHEVTNAEFKACVNAAVCAAPPSGSYSRLSYYGNPVYDDFPVINVDWYQAEDYCTWVEKRLPTEAEWEYAARGGLAGRRYAWGDTISGTDANYVWSGDPWDNDTSPVEYYDPRPTSPNGYGLYDMAGNLWEYVNDWYQSDYYTVSPPTDPPGPLTGTGRVLRGGSWTPTTKARAICAWQLGTTAPRGYRAPQSRLSVCPVA